MLSSEEAECLQVPDMGAVREFLKNALENKYSGEVHAYRHVVNQLQERDDPETLFRVYIGLCTCVSLLVARHDCYRDLVRAIFTYDWSGERRMNIAFTNLVGHLVSYNTMFLVPSLEMLVKAFTKTAAEVAQEEEEEAAAAAAAAQAGLHQQTPPGPKVLSEKMTQVHRTLHGLITLVPTGQAELFAVIEHGYPHSRFDVGAQTDYLTQLLYMCEYLPVMQPRILDLVVRKCLEIDVEIVIEEGLDGQDGQVKLEATAEAGVTLNDFAEDREDIFQLDDDDDDAMAAVAQQQQYSPCMIPTIGSSSIVKSAIGPGESGTMRIADDVVELANKLDAKLLVLIQFIDAQIARGDEEKSRIIFQLIAVYEDRILATHKSKFVQFALFFTSMRVDRFAVMLCDRLLHSFRNTASTHTQRQTCVMYLASFSARATFLPQQTALGVLDELLAWSHEYITLGSGSPSKVLRNSSGVSNSMEGMTDDSGDNDEDPHSSLRSGAVESGTSAHETFFCCVQAMCYMLCFFGTDVAAHYANMTHYRILWGNILESPLNPLSNCMGPVRTEFCRLAEAAGLLGADAVQRIAVAKRGTSTCEMLDSFFPFDPCLLRMTNSCVTSGYRPWRGIPGLDFPSEGVYIAPRSQGFSHASDGDSFDGMDSDSAASSLMSSASSAMGSSLPRQLNAGAAAFTPGTHYAQSGQSYGSNTDSHQSQLVGSTPSTSVHDAGSSYQSGADGYGPLPIRRPRNFSVGSAGSW